MNTPAIWLSADILNALRAAHLSMTATQAKTTANGDALAVVGQTFGIEPAEALTLPDRSSVRVIRGTIT